MDVKMNTRLVALFLLVAGTAMARPGGNENNQPPGETDFVKRFDQDNDGQVSESEFRGPAEHFTQLDKDGDGCISKDEAPKGPPVRRQQGQERPGRKQGSDSAGTDFVTRLDKDSDGRISSDEFDGPTEHFSHLDKNNDGYISKDEAPAGPPPRGRK